MASTYPRQLWVDEAVQFPDRYTKQDLTGGMVNLVPAPGTVDTVGTPQSAVNFNRLEAGILDAHIAHSLLEIHVTQKDDENALISDEITPEIGTVVLTNTKQFPFNYSWLTVALRKPRKTLNYSIEILSAVSSDGAPVGDCSESTGNVTNKQLNGFALSYSGSAASVTVTYKITGGFKV